MEYIKVGIIACSNTIQVLDCPIGACIKDLNNRKGAFKEYKNQEIELVGVISCNGCPTIIGAKKILPRVDTLIHYGATHIHLSYCMTVLCPFIKSYMKVIKENYQNIKLISGTHEPHQTDKEFRCSIEKMLKERTKTIIP